MRKYLLLVTLLLFAAFQVFPQTTVTIESVSANAGEAITVPINVEGFTNVGAISFKINYDTNVLTFTGVANAAASFTTNAAGGVLSLGWFDATASSPLNIASGKLLDLQFTYAGGNPSTLAFNLAESEVSNSNGDPMAVNYVNGVVTQVGNFIALELATVGNPTVGSVSVPLTVQNFSNVGAVSIKFSYDPAVLTFDGISDAPNGDFTANAGGGVVSIGWFDVSGSTPLTVPDGLLLNVNFTYNGGSTALAFDQALTEISNADGDPFTLDYTNGFVGSSVSVSLGNSVVYEENVTVDVPITVSDFYDVGAISLKVQYNGAVLQFQGLANAYQGATFTSNAALGVVTIGWFDPNGNTPLNIESGKLVDLRFTYVAGSSNLSFNEAQSEITNSVGTPLTVVYSSGSVTKEDAPPAEELVNWFEVSVDGNDFFKNDNNTRGLAYNPATGNLLVVSRTGTSAVHIMHGVTGEVLGTLDGSAIVNTGSTFPINLISVTDDGVIYAAGLALANQTFRVYRWADEAAAPTIAFEGVVAQRTGDAFKVVGTGTNTLIYGSGGGSNRVYIFSTADGEAFTLNTEVAVTAGLARGGIAPTSVGVNSNMWVNGSGTAVTLIDASGATVASISSTKIGTSFMHVDYFSSGGKDYIAVAGGNVEASSRRVEIWNVTVPGSAYLAAFGTMQGTWAANANGTGTVDVYFNADDDEFRVYHLVTNNLIAGYSDVIAPFQAIDLLPYWSATALDNTLPGYFSTSSYERGMAFGKVGGKDRVYVVTRNGAHRVVIHDANNGFVLGEIPKPTASEGIGLFHLNDVGVSDDGIIFVDNMTLGADAAHPFRVYRWDSETAAPKTVISYDGALGRMGDRFSVYGKASDNSLTIWAAVANGGNKVVKFTTADNGNTFTANVINLNGTTTNSQPNAAAMPDGTFYITSYGRPVVHCDASGNVIGTIPTDVVGTGSATIRYVEFNNLQYLLVYYPDIPGDGTGERGVMVDITNGAENAYIYYTTASFSKNANGNGAGSISFNAIDDETFALYMLGSNNGVIAFANKDLVPPAPLYPPAFISAESLPGYVARVSWAGSNNEGILVSLNNGDITDVSGYYQSTEKAYGSIFDLSGYNGATILTMDFAHGGFSFWQTPSKYIVHVLDLVNNTVLLSTDTLTANVPFSGGKWEINIDLGSLAASNLVGIFVQSVTKDNFGDAWPTVFTDSQSPAPAGSNYIIDDVTNPIATLRDASSGGLGAFMIDLWINVPGMAKPLVIKPSLAESFSAKFEQAQNLKKRDTFKNEYIVLKGMDEKIAADITGFNLYKGASTGALTLLAQLPKSAFEYIDTEILSGTYAYGISAQYGSDESSILATEFAYTPVSESLLGLDHTPGDLSVTAFNDGRIGALSVGGLGVEWKGFNGLWRGALIYGSSANGNAVGAAHQNSVSFNDLVNLTSYFQGGTMSEQVNQVEFDQVTYALISDNSTYQLPIIQATYSRTGDNFVFYRYGFINSGNSIFSGLYAGMFMDYDVGAGNSYTSNLGGVAESEHLVYMFHDANNPYFGVAAVNGLDGAKVTATNLTDVAAFRQSAFGYISNVDLTAPAAGDQRLWIGTHVTKDGGIKPGDTTWVTFAIVAGDNLFEIRDNANKAFAVARLANWSEISVDVNDGVLPTEFSISQNYPNPFNPSTTIKYALPAASQVKIRIYNTLGQVVKVLVDGQKPAGYHEINWNASNLASGVYLYSIEAKAVSGGKDFNVVKKMMLVK